MRLIYEWIGCDEKELFHECGVNFTDDYVVSYNTKTKLLSIRQRASDISRDFYSLSDPVVSQITCFVGKNGSGKTSILRHLFKSDPCICSDRQTPRYDTIEVYEFEDGLHVYHNFDLREDPANHNLPVRVYYDDAGKLSKRISKVFFTNNFFEGLNRGASRSGRRTLIAFTPYDMHMLQSEFFDRISATSHSPTPAPYMLFERRLKEYANPTHLYNIFYLLFLRKLFQSGQKGEFGYLDSAQVQFLPVGDTDAFIDSYSFFRSSETELKQIVAHSVSAAEAFLKQSGARLDYALLFVCAVCKWAEIKCPERSVLERNLVAELLLSLAEYENDLSSLPSYEPENLLAMLKERAEEAKAREIAYLEHALQSVRRAEGLLGGAQGAILLRENDKLLEFLEEELKSGSSFLLKYIWVSVNCSSGERAFLNIFASLNFIPYWQYCSESDHKGIASDMVLFLDEPDLYCHPEWQRKLLRHLIGMFEALYQGKSVHIIMSTHSPLFLSDIPNGNILLLERKERGGLTVSPMSRPSFGANLFDLYNDGFFTGDFIGEFAKEKIEGAIQKVQEPVDGEQKEELQKFIRLIGEPILRGSLNKMLEQKSGPEAPVREERE